MSDSTLVDHENQAQADALHKLVCYRQSHQKSGDRTVSFLLALVKYAPTRDQIAQDVINCDHRSLKVLFEKFRNGVTLPMRIFTTKPIDFMLEKESCTAMSRVLLRDNFRCTVSHYVDTDSLCEELTVAELGERAAEIHSALILPTGLCRAIDAEIPRMTTAKGASYRQALEAFIGVKLPSGDLAARVDNCISMEMSRKLMFNRLVFAFERTDVPNTYNVLKWGLARKILPDQVTFNSEPGFPAPNPVFLQIHAACAKILHESGIAQDLAEAEADYADNSHYLERSGWSARLLEYVLASIPNPQDECEGIPATDWGLLRGFSSLNIADGSPHS